MSTFPIYRFIPRLFRGLRTAMPAAALGAITVCAAQSNPPAPANSASDVLVLSNGDTLHGRFVNETAGKVTFHSDPLGDISVPWDKIRELRAAERFGVLSSTVKPRGKPSAGQIPVGTLDVANKAVTVHPANAVAGAPIPVADAQCIIDEATLNKQVYHQPGFFSGWSGPATAGATLVTATENQYAFSGAASLVRVVPTLNWLNPRDRTSLVFSGSAGKITQPGYTIPASGTTPPTTVAAVTTKTAIYHAGAERDEYFSARFFALGLAAFDHNYSQNLALQQIYGGGMGWTAIKTPKQELDVKATMQYEVQEFQDAPTLSLVGSTFSANYALQMKLFTYMQGLAFIPSYNDSRAYSATETDTISFPAYRNLSFTLGTLDSYLNDVPVSEPPTKRNSFQFTMGLTYAIKSKY